MARLHIAIDGPAGAGKSTIAKRLAEEFGILYVDTGAMYRALGMKALQSGVSPADEAAVRCMLPETDVRLFCDGGAARVLLDGKDVSGLIRTQAVSKAASDIAVHGCIRKKMVELQRQMAEDCDLVMDGRDIGTHVLPDAPYKFFLTASAEERARRRYEELRTRGEAPPLAALIEEIRQRDETDMRRAVAPLVQAKEAVLVDTTRMSIDEVVSALASVVRAGR